MTKFNWAWCDKIVQFAKSKNMQMRMHTLIWAKQGPWIPAWLQKLPRPGQVEWVMKYYITNVVKHYDYPIIWDVVNEALNMDGTIRTDHVFAKVPDFLCKSFKWAREADTSGKKKLYINDYCVTDAYNWGKKKSDGLFNLVKNLKERGCPVDGVGFQTHITTNYYYANQLKDGGPGIRENIRRYAKIGVETQMTEVDVACDTHNNSCKWGWEDFKLQARNYAMLLKICLQEPNCKAFVMWGFIDKYSWLNPQKALPWNSNYQTKPAFTSMLYEFNEYRKAKGLG